MGKKMRTKLAGSLIFLSGLGLAALAPLSPPTSSEPQPAFPAPRLMAANLCNPDKGWLKQRAFFLKLGQAYAQSASPIETDNTSLPAETVEAFSHAVTTSEPEAQT